MTSFLIGFGIIIAVMVVLCIAAVVVYRVIVAKNQKEAANSLPQGSDQSDFGKMLQDKYKAERDSGEFRRTLD